MQSVLYFLFLQSGANAFCRIFCDVQRILLLLMVVPLLLLDPANGKGGCEARRIFNVTENQLSPVEPISVYSILGIKPETTPSSMLAKAELIELGDASSGILGLDRRRGLLQLRAALDREDVCSSNNDAAACELAYVLKWQDRVCEFAIRILDENDNSPEFREKFVRLGVLEGSLVNLAPGPSSLSSGLMLPVAYDPDSDQFNLKRYSIKFGGLSAHDSRSAGATSQSQFERHFQLKTNRDSTGNLVPTLRVVKELDREKVPGFAFTLVAWDKGGKSGECRVSIEVEDINDHSPVWPSLPNTLDIRECTANREVLRLEATDADDPATPNGQVTFGIASSSASSASAVAAAAVSARDSVSMGNHADLFYVSGVVLYVDVVQLGQLTRRFRFPLTLTATDGGGRISRHTIEVKVVDCNDHRPSIEVKQRNPRISENITEVVKLTTIVVKDIDRGANADFQCQLEDAQHKFELKLRLERPLGASSSKSKLERELGGGKLAIFDLSTRLGARFDRESTPMESVIVRCSDKGVPAFTGSQTVTVHLDDVNDSDPRFEREFYTFTVRENVRVGSVVARVVAVDADSGENGRLEYRVHSRTGSKNQALFGFGVNGRGEIQTSVELDRETKATYDLIVEARDHGRPSLSGSCTVSLVLEDVNDCRPRIEKQYHFETEESHRFKTIHRILGRISATDNDDGVNGQLKFQLHPRHSGGALRSLIQVSKDGQVSIYGNIDREIKRTVQADIIVMDGGSPPLTAESSILVTVLDINDNKPEFQFPQLGSRHNHINISLSSTPGTNIAQITARDPDNGVNGTVTFSLLGDNSRDRDTAYFQLHPSGELMVLRPLQLDSQQLKRRKQQQGPELMQRGRLPDRLLIQAVDGGSPSLKQIVTLYLRYHSSSSSARGPSATTSRSHLARKKPDNGHRILPPLSGQDGRYNKNYSGKESTNVTLLYGLATVLFVVFAAVLMLLVFVFMKSRRGPTQEFSTENKVTPTRHRNKLYPPKESMTTVIRKSMDDLLASNLYEISSGAATSGGILGSSHETTYNHLMLMKEPHHYNLLYPAGPASLGDPAPRSLPTQTTLLRSGPHTSIVLNNLHDHPVELNHDDFGDQSTSPPARHHPPSSVASSQHFPVDKLNSSTNHSLAQTFPTTATTTAVVTADVPKSQAYVTSTFV